MIISTYILLWAYPCLGAAIGNLNFNGINASPVTNSKLSNNLPKLSAKNTVPKVNLNTALKSEYVKSFRSKDGFINIDACDFQSDYLDKLVAVKEFQRDSMYAQALVYVINRDIENINANLTREELAFITSPLPNVFDALVDASSFLVSQLSSQVAHGLKNVVRGGCRDVIERRGGKDSELDSCSYVSIPVHDDIPGHDSYLFSDIYSILRYTNSIITRLDALKLDIAVSTPQIVDSIEGHFYSLSERLEELKSTKEFQRLEGLPYKTNVNGSDSEFCQVVDKLEKCYATKKLARIICNQ